MSHVIQNFDKLATTEARRIALSIVEAGLSAINTEKVVLENVRLEGEKLLVKDQTLDLSEYKRIRIIGFGKASCDAATTLYKVLGERVAGGVVIDIKTAQCGPVASLVGTHPHPSNQNVVATRQIVELAEDTNEDDLILVLVSGGGSALLCWPETEFDQGDLLYSEFLKVGASISELNIVRKHLSLLKGGGLAKMLHPARVVGLVFCDVPGGDPREVASGPTYKDDTTIETAQDILTKYGIPSTGSGQVEFVLNETPKEDKYFEKVSNISLVSNQDALEAMKSKAEDLGLSAEIMSLEIYDSPEVAIKNFKELSKKVNVVLGGGEVKLVVEKGGGSGGRNVQLTLEALDQVGEDTFVSVASDGIDNAPAAGAIADKVTLEKVSGLGLDTEDYLKRCDSYNFFKQTDDLIITGQTGANVSDLMLWIRQ